MSKVQVFLLHFAGGNCYSYDFLKKKISNEHAEVYALELPGRGKRYNEDLILNKDEAIDDYVAQIKKKRNGLPYIIFGHSMGATLGLSVAHRMELEHDPPVKLVVSGEAGPGTEDKNTSPLKNKWHSLPDDEFKEVLRELGGIPEEVLENPVLFDYFGPIIRADFEVLEKHRGADRHIKINIPLHAVMGNDEDFFEYIDNWKNFTTAQFKSQLLPGNHFFIYDHPGELISILFEQ